ncbi:hypothetical protein BDZ89DRAFT_1048506 [Hymenopellis radicata]|nr:hypothetical protein BDZ89DRAFT_1048506 [Hymenopellis radicata]
MNERLGKSNKTERLSKSLRLLQVANVARTTLLETVDPALIDNPSPGCAISRFAFGIKPFCNVLYDSHTRMPCRTCGKAQPSVPRFWQLGGLRSATSTAAKVTAPFLRMRCDRWDGGRDNLFGRCLDKSPPFGGNIPDVACYRGLEKAVSHLCGRLVGVAAMSQLLTVRTGSTAIYLAVAFICPLQSENEGEFLVRRASWRARGVPERLSSSAAPGKIRAVPNFGVVLQTKGRTERLTNMLEDRSSCRVSDQLRISNPHLPEKISRNEGWSDTQRSQAGRKSPWGTPPGALMKGADDLDDLIGDFVVCAKIQTLSAATGDQNQNQNQNWEKIDQNQSRESNDIEGGIVVSEETQSLKHAFFSGRHETTVNSDTTSMTLYTRLTGGEIEKRPPFIRSWLGLARSIGVKVAGAAGCVDILGDGGRRIVTFCDDVRKVRMMSTRAPGGRGKNSTSRILLTLDA